MTSLFTSKIIYIYVHAGVIYFCKSDGENENLLYRAKKLSSSHLFMTLLFLQLENNLVIFYLRANFII